jgi:hypothetical protein
MQFLDENSDEYEVFIAIFFNCQLRKCCKGKLT